MLFYQIDRSQIRTPETVRFTMYFPDPGDTYQGQLATSMWNMEEAESHDRMIGEDGWFGESIPWDGSVFDQIAVANGVTEFERSFDCWPINTDIIGLCEDPSKPVFTVTYEFWPHFPEDVPGTIRQCGTSWDPGPWHRANPYFTSPTPMCIWLLDVWVRAGDLDTKEIATILMLSNIGVLVEFYGEYKTGLNRYEV